MKELKGDSNLHDDDYVPRHPDDDDEEEEEEEIASQQEMEDEQFEENLINEDDLNEEDHFTSTTKSKRTSRPTLQKPSSFASSRSQQKTSSRPATMSQNRSQKNNHPFNKKSLSDQHLQDVEDDDLGEGDTLLQMDEPPAHLIDSEDDFMSSQQNQQPSSKNRSNHSNSSTTTTTKQQQLQQQQQQQQNRRSPSPQSRAQQHQAKTAILSNLNRPQSVAMNRIAAFSSSSASSSRQSLSGTASPRNNHSNDDLTRLKSSSKQQQQPHLDLVASLSSPSSPSARPRSSLLSPSLSSSTTTTTNSRIPGPPSLSISRPTSSSLSGSQRPVSAVFPNQHGTPPTPAKGVSVVPSGAAAGFPMPSLTQNTMDDFVKSHRQQIRDITECCKMETKMLTHFALGMNQEKEQDSSTGASTAAGAASGEMTAGFVEYVVELDQVLEKKFRIMVDLRNQIKNIMRPVMQQNNTT